MLRTSCQSIADVKTFCWSLTTFIKIPLFVKKNLEFNFNFYFINSHLQRGNLIIFHHYSIYSNMIWLSAFYKLNSGILSLRNCVVKHSFLPIHTSMLHFSKCIKLLSVNGADHFKSKFWTALSIRSIDVLFQTVW